MPRLKKQQCRPVRAHHLRKCEQRVKELSASAVKVPTAFSTVKGSVDIRGKEKYSV
jgi:hypothetical protein